MLPHIMDLSCEKKIDVDELLNHFVMPPVVLHHHDDHYS